MTLVVRIYFLVVFTLVEANGTSQLRQQLSAEGWNVGI